MLLFLAPIPPENFIAQEIGWNQVQLKWATPNYTEPIKGYKIYYSPPFPPASKTVNDDVHQYLLADVFEVGVYYTFWATTLTKNLESSESERATLMIGPAATLNDLQHKNITNSSVVLEWKAVPERFYNYSMDFFLFSNYIFIIIEFLNGLSSIVVKNIFHHLLRI